MSKEEQTLTSLYNDIDVHSNITEIFENAMNTFNEYFGDTYIYDSLIRELSYIIDYKSYEILKFRDEYVNVFYSILQGSRDILDENLSFNSQDILETKEDIGSFTFKVLDIFERELRLDIYGLIREKDTISRDMSKQLIEFLDYDFHNSIEYIKRVINKYKSNSIIFIEEAIKNYQVVLWNIKKDLVNLTKGRDSINHHVYIDNVLNIREIFMEATDDLRVDIKSIYENLLIRNIDNIVREQLGVKLNNKLIDYKADLSKLLDIQMHFEGKDNYIPIKYREANINVEEVKIQVYDLFKDIFVIEYDYLKVMSAICKSRFEAIMDSSKYNLNTLFSREFEALIYYINSEEDFKRICNAFEEKIYYMLYNFTFTIFENVKLNYYKHIMKLLRRKKDSFDNMYFFTCMKNYTEYINNYNTSILIDIKSKIEEVYEGYENGSILYEHLPIVLNLYNMDDSIPKIFFREYIYDSDDYQNLFKVEEYEEISELECKKLRLHENIATFKAKLWEKIYSDLIGYFDYIFSNIGRNMEYIKSNMKK